MGGVRCALCGLPGKTRSGVRISPTLTPPLWAPAELAPACSNECARLIDMGALSGRQLAHDRQHRPVEAMAAERELRFENQQAAELARQKRGQR